MTFKNSLRPLFLLVCALSTSHAQASLFDRGNGLVYDDDLNITWLQDANFAAQDPNYSNGAMNWDEAGQWASNLAYDDGFGDVYTGWRLPSLTELNDLLSTEFNLAPEEFIYNSDISPFYGFVTGGKYWTSTEKQDSNDHAYTISGKFIQGTLEKTRDANVWAVRDGDVKPVPAPSMLLPFLGVMTALIGGRRTRI